MGVTVVALSVEVLFTGVLPVEVLLVGVPLVIELAEVVTPVVVAVVEDPTTPDELLVAGVVADVPVESVVVAALTV